MALYSSIGDEKIPHDAVKLNEEDAIIFMRNIVNSWKSSGDVFYIKYGGAVLSGLSALTALYLHNYYRYRLRLQSFGRMSAYLPVVVVPSVATILLHTSKVQDPILIDKYQCPVCLEIRGTIFQVLCGVAYPMVLAPIVGFMMGARYHTYNVPPINKDPKSVWKLYKKLSKPMIGTFALLAGAHVVASAFIVYKEAQSVDTVKRKLMQLEEKVTSRP